ncbi:MAG: DUF2244 domain-containing protein [Burkholderiaceae bacterium]|nr:DUF2244 domain-containing protein [Burkholderiaceae bacterium]
MSNPAFRWILKRNCSASPQQLALVFGSIVAVSFVFGAGFAAQGAWMVLPFVAVELLAVAAAFICYGRHAADFERIELVDGELRIERHDGARVERRQMTLAWARVELDEAGRGWMRRVRLYVAARGERMEIGRHLPDERRRVLAQELKRALQTAAPAAG